MVSNGGLDGAADDQAVWLLQRNEWLKLPCSAGQKLSDGTSMWGKLGTLTKMRDSDAWMSGLANMRKLENRPTRYVSCRDRVGIVRTPSLCLIVSHDRHGNNLRMRLRSQSQFDLRAVGQSRR